MCHGHYPRHELGVVAAVEEPTVIVEEILVIEEEVLIVEEAPLTHEEVPAADEASTAKKTPPTEPFPLH